MDDRQPVQGALGRRLRLAALAGATAVFVALALAPQSPSLVRAEPHAYQLWTSGPLPRQGRIFVGATLIVLSQSTVTIRPESVRFRCSRGVVRSSTRPRVRYAPVTTVRTPPEGNEPGPVIGLWTCVWQLPAKTAGLRLTTSYTRSAIDVDPVTGRELGRSEDGGELSWRIVR